MNEEKTKLKRKRYDEAFKLAAVEHWLSSGKAAKSVAAELGVNTQSLLQWKQRLGLVPESRGEVRTLEAAEAENRRLRREIESLVRQRESERRGDSPPDPVQRNCGQILKKLWASSPHRARAF